MTSVDYNNIIYTHEYFLQNDVCRFCWNQNAILEIITENIDKQSECEAEINNSLFNKIRDCLDINLEDINYPKKICKCCSDEIEKFYKFKSFCRESDDKLRAILKTPIKNTCEGKLEQTDVEFSEILDDTDLTNSDVDTEVKPKLVKVKKKTYVPKRCATYCNICKIDLETNIKFSFHNSEAHGIEGNTYKCFGCEKRFNTRPSRLAHEIRTCKELRKGYRCKQCGIFLPKRKLYETHVRNHKDSILDEVSDAIFKCTKCNRAYKTRDALQVHMNFHGKKSYVCESCGTVFSRQDYLHKHRLVHSGDKQHACPHCDYRATQRSSLTIHMRKHTGEKPYVCEMCPRGFATSSNLRAHRLRHFGVKRYGCGICDKKFGYKLSLDEHIGSVHESSSSFTCEHCCAAYSRARGLRRHLLVKHGKHEKNKAAG